MINYSEAAVFSKADIRLFEQATRMVVSVPDHLEVMNKKLSLLRCHELARAIGMVLGLRISDGKYGRVDHTWIWTSDIEQEASILDVYAVGSLPQVQLHAWRNPGAYYIPTTEIYVPSAFPRNDIQQDVVNELMDLWIGKTI